MAPNRRFRGSPVYQARPAPTIRRAGHLAAADLEKNGAWKAKSLLDQGVLYQQCQATPQLLLLCAISRRRVAFFQNLPPTPHDSVTLSSKHILPTILNNSVSLLGHILNIACCHRQIEMPQKPLNREWISRPSCQRSSSSSQRVEASSLSLASVPRSLPRLDCGALIADLGLRTLIELILRRAGLDCCM